VIEGSEGRSRCRPSVTCGFSSGQRGGRWVPGRSGLDSLLAAWQPTGCDRSRPASKAWLGKARGLLGSRQPMLPTSRPTADQSHWPIGPRPPVSPSRVRCAVAMCGSGTDRACGSHNGPAAPGASR
jgi:hypothetical protein